MRIISDIWQRVRGLVLRRREDRELDEELRFHLDMAVEENLRRGMAPEEARRQAILKLGGAAQTREETRDARGLRWLERLGQDVRYALRGVRMNPLFATTLVLTLGIGIGANAALFSVIDALLLRPLPYPDADQLVEVWAADPETGSTRSFLPLDIGETWLKQEDVFEAAFYHRQETVLYTGGPEPTSLTAQAVTPGFEETLRVAPALGRGITEEDAHTAAEPVVLLSDGLWRSAFGSDAGVLGRTIELDGISHRVIGVMPAGFKFPTYASTTVWTPLREDGTAFGRGERPIYLVARTPTSTSIEAVQAHAASVSTALAETNPRDGGWGVKLTPLTSNRGNDSTRRAIWFLAAAVTLILVVAALNGVNLLLVRTWSRTRELAVRVALGASRGRLVGHLLVESLILSLAAGAVAALLALAALWLIGGIIPSDVTFWAPYEITIERRTLLFTFALAAAAGMIIGLVPALLATRIGGATAADGALTPHAMRTPVRSRLRRGLVVAEVTLSVALLVGAGLLINSFVRLVRVDPGFRLDNIAVLTLSLSPAGYPTGETRMTFLRQLEGRLESIPGVAGATTGGSGIPAGGFTMSTGFETEDGPIERENRWLVAHTSVSPDFFALLEVAVLAGRPLTHADTDNVIVDLDLARSLWGDANPVGRRFRIDPRGGEWMTVVGVIGDVKFLGPHSFGPEELDASPAFLMPASARAAPYASIAVRATDDPRSLFSAIRAAVHELDPHQPISELETARKLYMDNVAMPRFLLVLMSVLSGLALLLAAVGIYGVLAYGVAQRRFDLGVRIALGARPGSLSRRVLGEGLILAATGALLGVAGALTFSRLIRRLLFEVEPSDPLTIAIVVGVSLLAAAVASWWPARRALRIDPVEVLKSN